MCHSYAAYDKKPVNLIINGGCDLCEWEWDFDRREIELDKCDVECDLCDADAEFVGTHEPVPMTQLFITCDAAVHEELQTAEKFPPADM